MNNLPHPIQYQGSKRNLAPVILHYFPDHVERLVEPFAGSAAISIASAAKGLATHYCINDINKPLVELLKLIAEEPEEIASCYERLWNEQHEDSLKHYYSVREEFNRTHDPRLFLYLLARCVKGSVRYNSEGLFNQSPDKRRHGTRPETMRRNIVGVSRLLKDRVSFSSIDYKQLLSNVNTSDLVYMDPPYQGVCGDRDSRYYAGVSYDDFVDALTHLTANHIAFIVSYDGRCGERNFGELLPNHLGLVHVEIEAGRSTQATLLGRQEVTYESLYLSKALLDKISYTPVNHNKVVLEQFILWERSATYAENT